MIARTLCFALSGTEGEPAGGSLRPPAARFSLPWSACLIPPSRKAVTVTAALKTAALPCPLAIPPSICPRRISKKRAACSTCPSRWLILSQPPDTAAGGYRKVLLLVNGAGRAADACQRRAVHGCCARTRHQSGHFAGGQCQGSKHGRGHAGVSARSLYEAAAHCRQNAHMCRRAQRSYQECLAEQPIGADQPRCAAASRGALEITAAGGHNLLMVGVRQR